MSTRGWIGYEHKDGRVECNYVGSDAGLEPTGAMLLDHYNTATKAAALVRWELPIDALYETKAKTHFREEGWTDGDGRRFDDMARFLERGQYVPFLYLWTNNQWVALIRYTDWDKTDRNRHTLAHKVVSLSSYHEDEYVAIVTRRLQSGKDEITFILLGVNEWQIHFHRDTARKFMFDGPIPDLGMLPMDQVANRQFPKLSEVRQYLKDESNFSFSTWDTDFERDAVRITTTKPIAKLLAMKYSDAVTQYGIKEYA